MNPQLGELTRTDLAVTKSDLSVKSRKIVYRSSELESPCWIEARETKSDQVLDGLAIF